MTHIPGGEVIVHPGPKDVNDGTKLQHGSHDVKIGYGGNEVSLSGGRPLVEGAPIGHHNTEVQYLPGNTVQIHKHTETKINDDSYADLLARVSSHSLEGLEDLATNLGLDDSKGIINRGELAVLITETILANEKKEKGENE